MAHPHVEQAVSFGGRPVLDASKQLAVPARADLCVAKFAHLSGLDRTSQLCGHCLHAVADTEYGHTLVPYCRGRTRRIALGYAVRAAGQYDSRRPEFAHEGIGHVKRVDLAIDVEF